MTTRFPSKDPGETRTLEFNFSSAGSPTSPELEVELFAGADNDPALILSGAPFVVGTKVYQRVQGGQDAADYAIRCFAMVGAERLLIDAILPVRYRPAE